MPTKDETIILDLEEEIQETLTPLARQVAEGKSIPQDPLHTPQNLAIQIEGEMKTDLNAHRQRCSEGFTRCLEELQVIAAKDIAVDLRQIKENLKKAFDKLDSLETIKKYVNEVMAGQTWCVLLGISEPSLQALYRAAKQIFDEKRYAEAECAFSFLSSIDSSQYAFWLGLGHASFHNKNFDEAQNAYAMASMCDSTAVWPHVYAANCFEARSDVQNALASLESAKKKNIESSERDRDFEEALHQRIVILQRI